MDMKQINQIKMQLSSVKKEQVRTMTGVGGLAVLDLAQIKIG